MAEIKINFADQVQPQFTDAPVLTGGGEREVAAIRALEQGEQAFLRVFKRQGEIAALKKSAELKVTSSAIFLDSVNNSKNDEKNVQILVDNPNALDPNSNGQTFSKHTISQYDAAVKKIMDGVDNPFARQILRQDIASERVRLNSKSFNYEARQTRQLNLELIGDTADIYSTILIDDPNQFGELNDRLMGSIDNAKLGSVDTKKTQNRLSNLLAQSSARGLIQQDPQLAKKVLNGEKVPEFVSFSGEAMGGEKAPFLEHLTANQLITLRNQADVGIERQLRSVRSELKNVMQSHFDSIQNTGVGVPGMDKRVSEAWPNNPEVVEEFRRNEAVVKQFHPLNQQLNGMAIEKIPEFLKTLEPVPGSKDFTQQLNLQRLALQNVNRQQQLMRDDPGKLVEDLFVDEMQLFRDQERTEAEISKQRLILQDMKGISENRRRLLTNSQREGLLESIQRSPADQILNTIQSIVTDYDKVFDESETPMGNAVIKELSQTKDGLSPVYRVILANMASRDDPGSRSTAGDLVKAEQFKKEINKTLTTEQKSDIEEKVNTASAAWFRAFTNDKIENVPNGTAMISATTQLASMYMIIDNMNEKEAVNKAVNNLITKKIAEDGIITNSATEGLIVPRQIIDGNKAILMNADNISDQLSSLKNSIIQDKFPTPSFFGLEEEAERIGITNAVLARELSNRIDLAKTIRGASDIFTPDFKNDNAQEALRNMVFINTPDGEGAMLMIKFINATLPILDKDSKEIIVKFKDINQSIFIRGR